MSIYSTRLPGVYMTVNSRLASPKDKKVCIAAASESGTAGECVTLFSPEVAETSFGTASDSCPMSAMIYAAFDNGAGCVCAVKCENDDDYSNAFSLFSALDGVAAIATDSFSQTVHSVLKETVEESCDAKKERFGVIPIDPELTNQQKASAAKAINSKRIIAVSQPSEYGAVSSAAVTSAAVGGIIAGCDNPSRSFYFEIPRSISFSSVISQADADFCISNGISVFNLSGNGEIVRLVTTETETDGRVDYSFSDISTVLAFDDVVRSVRDRLTEFISSSETNSVSYCAIESLIIMLFEEKTDSKIISGYEKPVISTDENDPSVCNILLRFSIAHGISRINVQADIGL